MKFFFVRTLDNRICQLIWNGTWQANPISTSMTPVRAGTDLIYDNNVIYYVGTNNMVCYISRPNPSSAFDTCETIGSKIVFPNSQIIYVGVDQYNTIPHIYYIRYQDNRVWEISKPDNTWVNSTNYLAGSSGLPAVRYGSQLTNDKNQIFYVGTDNKLYELHWQSPKVGWIGSLILPPGIQLVKNPSQITYFDNHIYYIGYNSKLCDLNRGAQWSGGTIGNDILFNNSKFTVYNGSTGHVIFTIGTDRRIRITLWDDMVCDVDTHIFCDYCTTKMWHNGVLNTTANLINENSNIAITLDPNNPNATPKSFYFRDDDGYGNVFLRSFLNDSIKSGWILTWNDEFNSLKTTTSLWDTQLPWSHGNCLKDTLWGERQWGKSFTGGNFSVNSGVGRITTKNDSIPGHTWGWNTGVLGGHYSDYCFYEYTNTILSTGGVNIEPDTNGQYYICTPNPPDYDRIVCVSGNYHQRFGPIHNPPVPYPDMIKPKFLQKYGWFEIRCKVPRGKYMWSAFWAVNKGYYPAEIDFFEIDGDGKGMLSNIYSENCKPLIEDSSHTNKLNYETHAIGYRFYDDFYTYACEWGPNYIKWYLNNELIAENYDANRMQHDSMWVIVNNYVYHARAKCEGVNFPNFFDIDYVRVYQNPAWSGLKNTAVSINDSNIEIVNDFSVYPNPTNKNITVESFIGTTVSNIRIDIFNLINQNLITLTYNNEDVFLKKEIDLSNQKNGIYFIRLSCDEKSITKKFILNKY